MNPNKNARLSKPATAVANTAPETEWTPTTPKGGAAGTSSTMSGSAASATTTPTPTRPGQKSTEYLSLVAGMLIEMYEWSTVNRISMQGIVLIMNAPIHYTSLGITLGINCQNILSVISTLRLKGIMAPCQNEKSTFILTQYGEEIKQQIIKLVIPK